MGHSTEGTTFNPSFGYHSSGSVESNTASIQTQMKINRLLGTAQKVAITAGLILAITTVAGLATFSAMIGVIAGFVAISAFYYGSKYYNYKQICETAGIVFRNSEDVKKFEVAGVPGKCEAIPTEHCADTEVWREELIKSAEHNIVISGNYCGGSSFATFLKLVEQRMNEKPDLKVVIISSPNFIKNGNLTKIEELQKKHPQNFSLVESPDIWHVSMGAKKSTNHTKCMVIDYGKYFILGGSGIKDNFAQTGLDDLSKEQFLAQKKQSSPQSEKKKTPAAKTVQTESEAPSSATGFLGALFSGSAMGSECDSLDAETAVLPTEEVDHNKEDGWLGKMIPGNFRDMDFVFRNSGDRNSSGSQVYKQMLLLCHRWEQYNRMLNQEVVNDQLEVGKLGVFTNKSTPVDTEDSVVVQLLKTPIPKQTEITTSVPAFDQSAKKSSDVAFQVFASGPEHDSSKFAAELEERINHAETKIVINHMYFHPTAAIMNALIAAAKRGVKIQIITAGVYKDCPSSHIVFGPRNKYNYAYLVNSLSDDERDNVEIYEFEQKKKGNHKKVIIVDDMVIAGSSNLGYKSLVTTSDHELNFFAKSQAFVDQTYEVCQIDISRSKKIEGRIALSINEYIKAALHRLMAPLIG